MTRQSFDLADRDLAALAGVMDTDVETLGDELARRPWFLNDVLRHPDTVDAVLNGVGLGPGAVSPLLFFAVVAHQAAAELADTTWVNDWAGPKSRLPVFDVDPLLEFTDGPGRLLFVARLLADFAMPEPVPVPADNLDLDDLVRWLDAAEPGDRIVLLRHLGDLALFQAGVFPDANGSRVLESWEAEHLGRSAGLDPDELLELIDPASATPGLDALEVLGSAWYQAAAEEGPGETPTVMLDVAARIRPARRFLNHVADSYLGSVSGGWAPVF